MLYTITGTLIQKGEKKTGTGKSGNWERMDFTVETEDGKFPKKLPFVAFGNSVPHVEKLKQKSSVTVEFDIESREYNDKTYINLKAVKVYPAQQEKSSSKQNSGMQPNSAFEDDGQLPF